MRFNALLLFLILPVVTLFSQAPNVKVDISGNKWNLWLDETASWQNDELFLPPVDLTKLPVNAPTCGWGNLQKGIGKSVTLPATIEEHFWGNNGNDFGISGNYTGVAWFSTKLTIPANLQEKRIWLDFESCRQRTEVYINGALMGYEMFNGLPFSVEITDLAVPGTTINVDVRITDPNGNFAWRDWETYQWGKYEIQPSHGFGGVTGKVFMRATDNSFISDVFVKNSPSLTSIDAEIEIEGNTDGKLTFIVTDIANKSIVYSKEFENKTAIASHKINVPQAKLWSPDSPNLYLLTVKFEGKDGSESAFERRFGFRWFEVREVAGDRMFFLNNKRVFALTAISWGHWPVNGIYPSKELAIKQIQQAKAYGMNMLTFHRGIGQTMIFDLADEMGIMYYQEPGGYKPGESEFSLAFKREKILRMAKRDRNHPSLVIYNMINESNRNPLANEVADIQAVHKVDPTRIITFTSTYFGKNTYGGKCPLDTAAIKMHMLPYDKAVHYYGWYDEHHADGPGVYKDEFYKGKTDFRLYINNPKEILFWGEDGAIGTPPRLELMKKEIEKSPTKGWDSQSYLNMYSAFDQFLAKNKFKEAFPSVDSLTRKMGNVALYYQGRTIENCRVGNLTDGYAINGWESTKIENHSGIVDVYRNPKGDVNILSRYNKPLYVSVKVKNKVVAVGDTTKVDFYIVNQIDFKGKYALEMSAEANGKVLWTKTSNVAIVGGNQMGQLLVEDAVITNLTEGYTTVKAVLKKGKEVVASGDDKIYGVKTHVSKLAAVNILDTSKVVQAMFDKAGLPYNSIGSATPDPSGNVLFVGKDLQPNMTPGNFRLRAPIMEWVQHGNTIVFTVGATEWAEYLNVKELIDYKGYKVLETNWFGGHFFNRTHPIFSGLPQNEVFNWEYQCLASYDRERKGMRLNSGECLVGCYADHNDELFSAMQIIPTGKGRIIITTLDIQKAISSGTASSVVAKRLLENIVRYAQTAEINKFNK